MPTVANGTARAPCSREGQAVDVLLEALKVGLPPQSQSDAAPINFTSAAEGVADYNAGV